jgi:hypothetical protein
MKEAGWRFLFFPGSLFYIFRVSPCLLLRFFVLVKCVIPRLFLSIFVSVELGFVTFVAYYIIIYVWILGMI